MSNNKASNLLTVLFIITLSSATPAFTYINQEEQFQRDEELLLLGESFVITPTRNSKRANETPTTVAVITAKQTRNMEAQTLLDVLTIVPGLGITIDIIGAYKSIEVRGIKTHNSGKVLLLLDGQALNFPYNSSPLQFFQDLVVNNIKQIEIVRGPSSAMYGTNAFLVTINIITKKAEDIDGIEFKAAAGSFSTQQYSMLSGEEFDQLKVSGYFEYFENEAENQKIDRDVLSAPPFSAFSTTPGYTQNCIDKKDLNLNFSYGDVTFWCTYMEKEQVPYLGAVCALNDDSELKFMDLRGERAVQHAFKNNLTLLARLYANQTDSEYLWELYSEGFPGYPNGMLGKPSAKTNTFGGEFKADYKIFKTNTVIVGSIFEKIKQYDVKHETNFHPLTGAPLAGGFQDITSWGNFAIPAKRQIWALYLQNDLDLISKYGVDLLMGIRYDRYTEFGGEVSPRAGILWRFIPKADFKVLYGRVFRAPNFEELYIQNNPSLIGNPNLKPEKLWTVETGINCRFTPMISNNLTYFHTEIKELINISSSFQYENFGNTKIHGVEAEVKADFADGHYTFANYTYQHPTKGGETLANVPKHRANLGINLRLYKYINSNTTVLFTGARPRVGDDSRGELTDQTIVHQTFILKNFFRTLELRASIFNLFDKHYAEPGSLHKSGSQNESP